MEKPEMPLLAERFLCYGLESPYSCLPLLYGAVSFVMVAIGCAVYNLIAGFVGGIEIELEE